MSNRVFATYGVGLNRIEMTKHCPTAKLLGATELKNFRLILVKQEINIELEIIASLVEEKKLNLEQLKTIMKIKKKEKLL